MQKLAINLLEDRNAISSRLVNQMVIDTLSAYILREFENARNDVTSNIKLRSDATRGGNLRVLFACASFSAVEDLPDKQKLIGDLIILAHNVLICEASQSST